MFDRLTIRMYDAGFGDCFLLTFYDGGRIGRVLIDCGSISRSKAEVAKIVADLIATCTPPSGAPRIDLVVCTHRHKDHVYGFQEPAWAGVEVGEVWMPWTEDPRDPDATRIRNRQSNLAAALCEKLEPGGDRDALPLAAAGNLDDKSARLALALNALTNESAMNTLHKGFKGRPERRFLPEKGAEFAVRTLASLPGVRFHVLGPSRDERVIAKMDPPERAAYLDAASASASADGNAREGACDPRWRIEQARFDAMKPAASSFKERDRRDVERLAEEPDGDLAAAIDNAVNNTSLMLMIEIGDQFLLFPGDAQWGSWEVLSERGDAKRLLQRTTVLKVSHHASHNGTPKYLVEKLLKDGATAFVSTASIRRWPTIPRQPLLDALGRKTTLARNGDRALAGRPGFLALTNGAIEWETAIGPG